MVKKMFTLVFLTTAFACTTAEEKLSSSLQEKVMQLHDTLMPQTEQLISLKSSLDSISKGKDSVHIKQIIHALDHADHSMMDWMHQFSLDSLSKLAISEKVTYLQSQYSALTRLKTSTDSSLHAAKTYLSR
jgi:transposase-like protein